jgi:hypothetical protein
MVRGGLSFIFTILTTALVGVYLARWGEGDSNECETTYIYEGYEPVELPSSLTSRFPRYKVVRYVDQDPALQVHIQSFNQSPRQRATVLFVHGHLGSPSQMRSMASETSRELVRRSSSNPEPEKPIWIDWLAVDFGSEPSAFEPLLLHRQSHYVAECMSHIMSASSVLVVVGFSMGGIAVEQAMQLLDSEFPRIKIRPSMVLTLGSPRQYWPTFLSARHRHRTHKGIVKGEVELTNTMINIVAGPGDALVSRLSAWTGMHRPETETTSLDVDMEDIPGVWTTCTHSDIVSCNQLVRVVVAMLVEVVMNKSNSTEMYRRWLTSNVHRNNTIIDLDHSKPEALVSVQRCQDVSGLGGMVFADLDVIREDVCYKWKAEQEYDHFVVAAFSGSEAVELFATTEDSSTSVELSYSLYPNRQVTLSSNRKQRRHWAEVMAGIDWRRNAIKLYYHRGVDNNEQVKTFVLRLRKSSESLRVVMAPLAAVPSPGLPRMDLDLSTTHWWGVSLVVGSSRTLHPPLNSPLYLLHSPKTRHPKWRSFLFEKYVRITVRPVLPSCDRSVVNRTTVPVLIASATTFPQGSPASMQPHDTVRLSSIPLWHPGVSGRDILLLADPLCSYTVTRSPDVLLWASSTVRHHLVDLYPLVLARVIESMMVRRSSQWTAMSLTMVVVVVVAVATVACDISSPSSSPLDVPGALVLILAARCLHSLLGLCELLSINLPTHIFSTMNNRSIVNLLGLTCFGAAALLHPGIASLGGLLVVVVPPKVVPTNVSLYHKWRVFHCLTALPGLVWLYGWVASGDLITWQPWERSRSIFLLLEPGHSMTTVDLVDVVCVWTIAFHAYMLGHIKTARSVRQVFVHVGCICMLAVLTLIGVGGHTQLVLPSLAVFCACDLFLFEHASFIRQ